MTGMDALAIQLSLGLTATTPWDDASAVSMFPKCVCWTRGKRIPRHCFSLAQFLDLLAHRPGQLLLEDACSLGCNQLVAPIKSVRVRRPDPVGSPGGGSGSWQRSVESLPLDADDVPLSKMTAQGQQALRWAGSSGATSPTAMSIGRGGTGRRKTRGVTHTRGDTLLLAWPAAVPQ